MSWVEEKYIVLPLTDESFSIRGPGIVTGLLHDEFKDPEALQKLLSTAYEAGRESMRDDLRTLLEVKKDSDE